MASLRVLLAAIVLAVLVVSSSSQSFQGSNSYGNNKKNIGKPLCAFGVLADVLSKDRNLAEFSKLLRRSNLTTELKGQGPYTVFAPSNQAFKDLSADVKQSLAQNPQQLQKLLEYHVVKGLSVYRSQMRSNKILTTLSNGSKLQVKTWAINWWSTKVSVEGSCIKSTVPACNGVIHIIDKVLVPPPSANLLKLLNMEPRLSLYRSLVTNTSVEALLGNDNNLFTIFAPSNDAILAAMSDNKTKGVFKDTQAFIKRHIIQGRELSRLPACVPVGTYSFRSSCRTKYRYSIDRKTIKLKRCANDDFKINGIKANTTDISAINGVLHVIDGVILKNKVRIATWGGYRTRRHRTRRFRSRG